MSSTAENQRVNFASIKNQFPYPDFLEVQLKSFQDFLQLDTPPEKRKKEGLYKVFAENFPIADTRNNFVLEFLDYYIDPPRYCIDECIARGLTYSVPLKAKLKLYCTDPDHEDFDTVIQDVYLGPIPYMTDRGTFVSNGAYANENTHLLMDILRGDWGFDGAVVTDWGGSNDHALGVKNGSTLEMPAPGGDAIRELMKAVQTGKISEADVDARLD